MSRPLPILRAGVCMLAALSCGIARAGPDLLDLLMSRLAQRRHGEADFEQTQYLASMRRPLHSRGRLVFDAPAHLEERTLEPREQSAVVDAGVLTLTSGAHRRTLELSEVPQISPLLESLRATLAGDRASLESHFDVAASGSPERWELRLRPRAADTAVLVESVRIAGAEGDILEVEVRQSDGDHSLMSIHPHP